MIKICKKKRIRYYILLFLLPALIVYTFFMTLPLINSLILSFYSGKGLIPDQFVGFANYIKLFTKSPFNKMFFNAFWNNVKFFVMVTIFQNVTGFVMAVMVTRKFRASTFFRRFFFLPVTLSVIVTGFLFSLMLNPIWGFIDKIIRTIGLGFLIRPWLGDSLTALPAISLVVAWQYLGMPILFFTAAIDGIDSEIFESANLDGAGILATVRYIIFPLILPVIGIVMILTFVSIFTGFDIIYAMATSRGEPAYSTDIFGTLFYRSAFSAVARGYWGMGMGATIASVMFIIVLLGVLFWLFLFMRKKERD